MRNLRAVVIGAGALGNAVIQSLCMAGAAEILVVDPDTVEASNQTRAVFFHRSSSIGRKKVEVIAETAAEMFPDTCIRPFPREVADVCPDDLQRAHVWFACVHSLLARVETAYLANHLSRPVVDGGLGGEDTAHGRVSWFPPDGACFSCILPRSIRARLLSQWDPQPSPCTLVQDDDRPFHSTPTMSAITAGLQVELGLRSYFEGRRQATSWRLWTSHPLRVEEVTHLKSELCPFHWPQSILRVEVSKPDCTVKDILSDSMCSGKRDPYLLLHWPICVAARCSLCGALSAPFRRTALIARRTACPNCGEHALREVESVRALSAGDRWAECSVSKLGVIGSALVGYSEETR